MFFRRRRLGGVEVLLWWLLDSKGVMFFLGRWLGVSGGTLEFEVLGCYEPVQAVRHMEFIHFPNLFNDTILVPSSALPKCSMIPKRYSISRVI